MAKKPLLGEPIAQIIETNHSGAGVPIVMLLLGTGVAVLAMVGDSSAIRAAFYAAAWTGWNVLWGALGLLSKKTTHTVYRMPQKADPKL